MHRCFLGLENGDITYIAFGLKNISSVLSVKDEYPLRLCIFDRNLNSLKDFRLVGTIFIC